MEKPAAGEPALGADLVVAGAGGVGIDAETRGDLVEGGHCFLEVGDRFGGHGQTGPAGGSDGSVGGVRIFRIVNRDVLYLWARVSMDAPWGTGR